MKLSPKARPVRGGYGYASAAAAIGRAVVVALCVVGASEVVCGATSSDYQAWGEETLEVIRRDFSQPGFCMPTEKASDRNEPARPVFMWGAGVHLSALAAAAQSDPERHADALARFIECLDKYWCVHREIGGYNSFPGGERPDRYYDDNAWIVLGLVESYEVANERRYLTRAEETFAFVLSGEDDRLGGGIYWRENTRQSKNTCSNAPAIVGALRLYQHTRNEAYLQAAQRLYEWTCDKLQDAETGLFFDHRRLDDKLDTRLYAYNTALMMRANCLLYQLASKPSCLAEAERLAHAADRQWIDDETLMVCGQAKFAHLLLEALLEVDAVKPAPKWVRAAESTATRLHNVLRSESGHYPRLWSPRRTRRRPSDMLIDQASAARTFFVLALATNDSLPSSAGAPRTRREEHKE